MYQRKSGEQFFLRLLIIYRFTCSFVCYLNYYGIRISSSRYNIKTDRHDSSVQSTHQNCRLPAPSRTQETCVLSLCSPAELANNDIHACFGWTKLNLSCQANQNHSHFTSITNYKCRVLVSNLCRIQRQIGRSITRVVTITLFAVALWKFHVNAAGFAFAPSVPTYFRKEFSSANLQAHKTSMGRYVSEAQHSCDEALYANCKICRQETKGEDAALRSFGNVYLVACVRALESHGWLSRLRERVAGAILCRVLVHCMCIIYWDSVVGIATGYGLDDRGVGVRVPVGSIIFCSPRRPDRLWGPPNLLSNWYWGFFLRG
jgi:hypothetical protein